MSESMDIDNDEEVSEAAMTVLLAIQALAERDGRAPSGFDIAEHTGIEAPVVDAIISVLLARGLIGKQRH